MEFGYLLAAFQILPLAIGWLLAGYYSCLLAGYYCSLLAGYYSWLLAG